MALFDDMKRSLQSIFGNDQPTALDSATQMMQVLPQQDLQSAHKSIIESLQQLHANEQSTALDRWQAIDQIDQTGYPIQQAIGRTFLLYHGVKGRDLRPLLKNLVIYLNELNNGYRLLLTAAQGRAQKALRPHLNLIMTRMMAAYADLARWGWVRYRPVDSRIWNAVIRLYAVAEYQGFITVPVELYPGKRHSSCQQEFLRLALMHLVQPGTLTIRQIALLDMWLQHHANLAKVEREPNPHQQVFSFDLSASTAPRRLRRNQVGTSVRYINTLPIRKALLTLQAPDHDISDLGLGKQTWSEEDRLVFWRAQAIWSREEAPIRKRERHASDHAVAVFLGPEPLYAHLGKGKTESGHFSWWLEDQSQLGLGLSAPANTALPVGTLITVEQDGQWLVGIVKRQEKLDELKIGAEIIGRQPRVVPLVTDEGNKFTGILLSTGQGEVKSWALLLPPGNAMLGDTLTLKTLKGDTPVRLGRRVAGGEQFQVHVLSLINRGAA